MKECKKKHIAIFASGRGSNATALYEAMKNGRIQGELQCIICDKEGAPILEKAKSWGVSSFLVVPKDFPNRQSYERAILELLKPFQIDGIALAGYMRILGEDIVKAYEGKILNIHPSLLPDFRGLHAQRQALEAHRTEAGCTVHFVDGSLDSGPIILQGKVPILEGDTEETLSARLLPKEHETYVEALRLFCEGALTEENTRKQSK